MSFPEASALRRHVVTSSRRHGTPIGKLQKELILSYITVITLRSRKVKIRAIQRACLRDCVGLPGCKLTNEHGYPIRQETR